MAGVLRVLSMGYSEMIVSGCCLLCCTLDTLYLLVKERVFIFYLHTRTVVLCRHTQLGPNTPLRPDTEIIIILDLDLEGSFLL